MLPHKFYLILSCVFCLSIGAVINHEDILRKAFLEKAATFDASEGQQVLKSGKLVGTGVKSNANYFSRPGITENVLMTICSFLKSEDLSKLNQTCTEFYNAVGETVRSDLQLKNLKLVTSNCAANLMLLTFLQEQAAINCFDPDSLELLTFKFIDKDGNNFVSSIPRNINLQILNFLHLMTYGPDAHFPTKRLDWQINFLKKLRTFDNLEQTANFYYIELIDMIVAEQNIRGMSEHISFWKMAIELFYNRTDDQSIVQMVKYFGPLADNDFTRVTPDISCNLIDYIFPHFRRRDHQEKALEIMFKTNSFSDSIWNTAKRYDDLLLPLFDKRVESISYRWNKALVMKFLGDQINGLNYLLTRNASNTFDLAELLDMDVDMTVLMREFLYCATPNLVETDIFYQIVHAGLFPLELVDQAKQHSSGSFTPILERHGL